MVVDYFDYILGKLEESKTKRERFVTTDLNLVKAIRELEKKGLVQYRMKMQPAQPLGLICHDDGLNTKSDWAEKMVCQLTGAKQTAWNCKGHDGVLPDGTKIEVKHTTWYQQFEHTKGLNISLSKKDNADVFVIVLSEMNSPKMFSCYRFFVLDLSTLRELTGNVNTHIFTTETGTKYRKLLKHECILSELANLKHGYDYFLKMKGKTPPVEMPKESIQFVIDTWEPNKYGLMPFDWRYEDSSWYAEYLVSYFLRGVITEQRQKDFDVKLPDGSIVSVKSANISPCNYTKSGITYKINFKSIKTSSIYDFLVCVYWDDIETKGTCPWKAVKLIILPKEIADKFKIPEYRKNPDKGELKFTLRQDGKYRKNAAIHKFRPFMFTIDHLAELGQIGWNDFYDKYLKEACEEALQKYGKGDH